LSFVPDVDRRVRKIGKVDLLALNEKYSAKRRSANNIHLMLAPEGKVGLLGKQNYFPDNFSKYRIKVIPNKKCA
jgi:hypothetical protein